MDLTNIELRTALNFYAAMLRAAHWLRLGPETPILTVWHDAFHTEWMTRNG